MLLICFFAFSFSLIANDTISFTWKGGHFKIIASENEQFTIDWGDGSAMETKSGTGKWQLFSQNYSDSEYMVTVFAVTSDCQLTAFDCFFGKEVTSLDVKNCPSLTWLNCSGNNSLSSLDISNNIVLKRFECIYNQIDSLNISNNLEITGLWCYYNQLNSLLLGDNEVLTKLDCSNNKLITLHLDKCTSLKELICRYNQLVT